MGSRSRFLFTLAWFVTALPAAAATFTVNNAVDAVPGDGTCASAGSTCTLRAAIQEDVVAIGLSSYNGGHIEFFEEVVDKRRQEVRNRQLSLAGSAVMW